MTISKIHDLCRRYAAMLMLAFETRDTLEGFFKSAFLRAKGLFLHVKSLHACWNLHSYWNTHQVYPLKFTIKPRFFCNPNFAGKRLWQTSQIRSQQSQMFLVESTLWPMGNHVAMPNPMPDPIKLTDSCPFLDLKKNLVSALKHINKNI